MLPWTSRARLKNCRDRALHKVESSEEEAGRKQDLFIICLNDHLSSDLIIDQFANIWISGGRWVLIASENSVVVWIRTVKDTMKHIALCHGNTHPNPQRVRTSRGRAFFKNVVVSQEYHSI